MYNAFLRTLIDPELGCINPTAVAVYNVRHYVLEFPHEYLYKCIAKFSADKNNSKTL